jgi:phage-related protein
LIRFSNLYRVNFKGELPGAIDVWHNFEEKTFTTPVVDVAAAIKANWVLFANGTVWALVLFCYLTL